jgi:hypothetical protein
MTMMMHFHKIPRRKGKKMETGRVVVVVVVDTRSAMCMLVGNKGDRATKIHDWSLILLSLLTSRLAFVCCFYFIL